MSQPGWYPDPGGQSGQFRFWDGRAWSASTTDDARSAPPAGALGQPSASGYGGQAGFGGQTGQPGTGQYGGQYGGGQYGGSQYGATTYAPAATKPKGKATWWIVAIVLALVVILAAVFGVRALLGRSGIINPGNPGGSSSREICPEQQAGNSPAPQPNDGRVHGGQLSYPTLKPPFEAPTDQEFRVPFGRGVLSQSVIIEPDYDGTGSNWVASVLVGELVAGDGFFSPQDGSEIVVKCIVGKFYGDNAVTRDDKKSAALKVDGKEAWVVESHLTFDIEGLETKGELLIVVIVATSDASSSLFYASIPDTSPQLVQPARDAMKNLKVDS